ncbi:MAG: prepilin-type cleavage/methylation domain-containing protein [Verrucomicrobia bacterium]|nr:prepilin-type cleavage/methylation domain-containing protein [Verrucomicrobiota bacterium]
MSPARFMKLWEWLIVVVGLFTLWAIVVPRNFVRGGGRHQPPMTVCINNLRQIYGAMEQWGLEHPDYAGRTPGSNDLAIYIHGGFPKCPAGGVYTIRAPNEPPRCSITNHVLR